MKIIFWKLPFEIWYSDRNIHLEEYRKEVLQTFSLSNPHSKDRTEVRRLIKLKKGRGEEGEFRKEGLIWVRLT